MQQAMQEDYGKLEVLAFEMETTIGSLEEELAAANLENKEMLARNESLTFELELLSDKLETSNTELNALNEELLDLRSKLEISEASNQKVDSHMKQLVEEKEELAMQLTNALLEMEEERAVWSAKEKASMEAMNEKANIYNDDITALSNELCKVRNEMMCLSQEYELLQERHKSAEDHTEEVTRLQRDLATLRQEQGDLALKFKDRELMSETQVLHVEGERNKMMSEIEKLRDNEAEFKHLWQDYDEKISRARLEAEQLSGKLADLEHKIRDDGVKNGKDRTKLRMRLFSTQSKIDAFRERDDEAIDEQELMHKSFEEASAKLKDQLRSYGLEILNLKKQLASTKAN